MRSESVPVSYAFDIMADRSGVLCKNSDSACIVCDLATFLQFHLIVDVACPRPRADCRRVTFWPSKFSKKEG